MRTRAGLIVPLATLSLVVTACGGSDENTSGAGSGSNEEGMENGVVVRMDGESVDDYIQRLYEAAQEEGRAVYYTPAQEREVEAVRTYWEETFPEVELQVTAGGTDQILQRALTEGESGRTQADAMQVSVAEMVALRDAGLLAMYRPANEEFSDPSLVEPDQPWSIAYYLSFHVTYNTDRVDPSELPTDLRGFTEPQWKGQVAVDLNAVEWTAGLIEHFGEEEATELLEGLAANDLLLVEGTTNRTEQLSAGQFDVMLDGYGHSTKRFILKGAPVAVPEKHPDPVSQVLAGSVVFGDAPNPNAARLLSEFFLMEEGQQVYIDQNKAGARVASGDTAHPYEELFGGVDPTPLGSDVDFGRAIQMFDEIVVRRG
jgi:iron(III) transport system substrate-binding protein